MVMGGGIVFEPVTTTLAEAVQPLLPPPEVMVYVPAVVTVIDDEVDVNPPFELVQRKVLPVLLAEMVGLGFVHAKATEVGLTVIVGKALFSVTTILVEAVQPFEPVAVTTYVPVTEIIAMAVEAVNPPVPIHEYVLAPLAVKLVLGLVQVSTGFAGLIDMVGDVLFSPTTTLIDAVQPFVPVAVTIYVPAVEILAVAVEAVNPPVPVHA